MSSLIVSPNYVGKSQARLWWMRKVSDIGTRLSIGIPASMRCSSQLPGYKICHTLDLEHDSLLPYAVKSITNDGAAPSKPCAKESGGSESMTQHKLLRVPSPVGSGP